MDTRPHTVPGGTFWACTDCLIARENGEAPTDRPTTEPEPWALWADSPGDAVTLGMLASEHECGWDGGPRADECSCEVQTFTWSACGACGSTLGGERHAYTYWTPAEGTDGPAGDVPADGPFPGRSVGESLSDPRVTCCGRDSADCDCPDGAGTDGPEDGDDGPTDEELDSFTQGYAMALLWANTRHYDSAEEFDGAEGTTVDPYGWHTPGPLWALEAFDSDSQASIRDDCEAFVTGNLADLREYVARRPSPDGSALWECAGHDFLLTRSGHGAGFWDRGLGELGRRLTDASEPYGDTSAHVFGDDSEAHLEQ